MTHPTPTDIEKALESYPLFSSNPDDFYKWAWEHRDTIRAALEDAKPLPRIKGLEEAIQKFKHFVLTGESGGAGMTYPIEKAATEYAKRMSNQPPTGKE